MLKNNFYETLDPLKINKVIIYTDASLNPNTQDNGIGIYCQTTKESFTYKIRQGPSICTTELYAIQIAVEWAISKNHNNILIASDSLSALTILENENYDYNTVDYIYSLPNEVTVTFIWTPSHVGIIGNEMADQLANNAMRDNNLQMKGIIPRHDATKVFKKQLYIRWKIKWANSQTGGLLASINDTPGTRSPSNLNNRKLESAINRLCTNRANLGYFKHMLKITPTPHC